jgi:hypothetical protein
MQEHEQAFAEKRAGIGIGQAAVGEYAKAYEKNFTGPEGRIAHRKQTMETRAKMHKDAVAQTQDYEMRLQQKLDSIPSMDPDRYWRNADTGQKIAGVMSAAIAGWLNPGGPNQAVDLMMKLADRDVQAQMEDIKTQKFQVQGMERGYQRLVDRHTNDRKQYLELRAMGMASIEDRLLVESNKYKSAITLGKFQDAIGTARAAKVEAIQGLIKQEYDDAMAQAQEVEDTRQFNVNQARMRNQFKEEMQFKRDQAAAKSGAGSIGPEIGYLTGLDEVRYAITVRPGYEGNTEKLAEDYKALGFKTQLLKELKENLLANGAVWNKRIDKAARVKQAKQIVADWVEAHRDDAGANFTESEAKRMTTMIGNAGLEFLDNSEIVSKALDRKMESLRVKQDGIFRDTGASLVPIAAPPGPVVEPPDQPGDPRKPWEDPLLGPAHERPRRVMQDPSAALRVGGRWDMPQTAEGYGAASAEGLVAEMGVAAQDYATAGTHDRSEARKSLAGAAAELEKAISTGALDAELGDEWLTKGIPYYLESSDAAVKKIGNDILDSVNLRLEAIEREKMTPPLPKSTQLGPSEEEQAETMSKFMTGGL